MGGVEQKGGCAQRVHGGDLCRTPALCRAFILLSKAFQAPVAEAPEGENAGDTAAADHKDVSGSI